MESVTVGPCTLYRGDCAEVLQVLGPGVADAVVTSPPYNCGKEYGTHADDLDPVAYWSWLEERLHKAVEVLAPHGYLCVNHANYIGSRETREFVPDELRPMLSRLMPFVDWIIWDKGPANGAAWGNFRTSPRMRAQHENIFVHGGVVQMPPSDIDWEEWSKFTTSIWRIPTTDVDATIHPAMMPVEVATRLCKLYSPVGGTILDQFMGSGQTGVAAIRAGRRFIGIEIDEKHFETSLRRLQRAWRDERSQLPFAKPADDEPSPALFN